MEEMSKTIATFTRNPPKSKPKGEQKNDGSFRIHLDEIYDILMKPEVKNMPVCVYSIVGPYRSGKSFLMNCFIRYLEARERGLDCPFADTSKKLHGFSWGSESDPVTEGVNMWYRPFVIRRNSDNKKVAVILVDTQGMSDSRLDQNEEILLFAVNCIISKTLIFNLEKKIQEGDLRMLARAIKAVTLEGKAEFFNGAELLTLVRDWEFSDLQHGLSGGKNHLDSKLRSEESYREELQHTRDVLGYAFKDMQCYLMPLIKAEEGFDGALKDLGIQFVEHLEKLADHLFSDNFLQPKPMAGRPMTCEDIYMSLKAFHKKVLFGGSAKGIEAFEEACREKVAREFIEEYEQKMAKIFAKGKPCLGKDTFDRKHEEMKNMALSNVKDNLSRAYLDYAALAIDKVSELYRRKNNANSLDRKVRGVALATATYEELMEKMFEGWKAVVPFSFNKYHSHAMDQALLCYEVNVPEVVTEKVEGRKEVISFCNLRHQYFEQRNKYNYLLLCGAFVTGGTVAGLTAGTAAMAALLPEILATDCVIAGGAGAVGASAGIMVDVAHGLAGNLKEMAPGAARVVVKVFQWAFRRY